MKLFGQRGARLAQLCLLICSALWLGACGGGGGGAASGGTAIGSGTTPASAVSGQVLDAQGQPVAGVTISAFHHNDNSTVTTTTDAQGAYRFASLNNGNNSEYAFYADKSGLAFYPSATDAAAKVTRFDFNGYYRTVVQFLALPGRDVSGVSFTALRVGDKRASLARTGQTVSYASGDDAAAHQGVAWPTQRFADNLDGTVTDRLTGLVWLKDAGCLSPSSWSAALTAANQLAQGACGLNDGSRAGTWRMPNINEMESLVDVAQFNPAVSAGHPFTGIRLHTAYWSSTTYTALSSNAMALRLSDGRWINGVDAADGNFSNDKASAVNALWAVKSGSAGVVALLATGVYTGQGGGSFGVGDDASLQLGTALTSPRFIDQNNGTLVDSLTGLVWLKKADCINQSWAAAVASVNQLASGACGLNDGSKAGQWRMPNRAEMLSLSDRAPSFPQASYFNGQAQGNATVTGPVIFNNFIVSNYYWTSSTVAADSTQAWSIYSCDFGVYNLSKAEVRYALAVR